MSTAYWNDFCVKVSQLCNHTHIAKRRMMVVMGAKNKKQRKTAYFDLFEFTSKVFGYSRRAVVTIKSVDLIAFPLLGDIEHYADPTKADHQSHQAVCRVRVNIACSEKSGIDFQ